MTGYSIVNLADLITEFSDDKDRVNSILSTFDCEKNQDVEYFLKQKAIEFSNHGWSKTQLVFSSYKDEPVLIGYFTLTQKTIVVSKKALSKSYRKRIAPFGKYDHAVDGYVLPAILIAQVGKNFSNGFNKMITGDELLKIACNQVQEIQRVIGGKYVYLECEDTGRLIEFYESNGFVCFGKRQLDSDEKDHFSKSYLLQMLKYFKG